MEDKRAVVDGRHQRNMRKARALRCLDELQFLRNRHALIEIHVRRRGGLHPVDLDATAMRLVVEYLRSIEIAATMAWKGRRFRCECDAVEFAHDVFAV